MEPNFSTLAGYASIATGDKAKDLSKELRHQGFSTNRPSARRQRFWMAIDRLMFGSKLAAIRKQVDWRETPKPRNLERGSVSMRRAA